MPLSELLAGWAVEPVRPGIALSGAIVERWTRPGEPDRFHKAAPPTWDRGLDAEAARLRWLATTPFADRVAKVLHHGVDDGGVEHLVTTAVPGEDGVVLAERGVEGLAQRYGAALRKLHDTLDPDGCPFDRRLDVRLEAAERRIAEGGVDPADFEPEYADRTPAELLALLRATRPDEDADLVVGHGDWCYPNAVFEGDTWGMIDLADLGVCSRWYDLGIGARSTVHNLGDAAVPAFFDGYGVEPDEERVRYYIVLDELQ